MAQVKNNDVTTQIRSVQIHTIKKIDFHPYHPHYDPSIHCEYLVAQQIVINRKYNLNRIDNLYINITEAKIGGVISNRKR